MDKPLDEASFLELLDASLDGERLCRVAGGRGEAKLGERECVERAVHVRGAMKTGSIAAIPFDGRQTESHSKIANVSLRKERESLLLLGCLSRETVLDAPVSVGHTQKLVGTRRLDEEASILRKVGTERAKRRRRPRRDRDENRVEELRLPVLDKEGDHVRHPLLSEAV